MSTLDLLNNLPDHYLEDKNTLEFRFYVLDDIVHAGSEKPIPYDDAYEPHILQLYQDKPDVALYVHSPWCRSRCTYCYYHQGLEVQEQEMRDLIQAEQQHALSLENKISLKSKTVRSIYFGGGTPTVLPDTLLEENLSFFTGRYAQKGCEVCCEASPYTLNPEKLNILEKYVTRLSIGIQSFDEHLLRGVGRKPINGPVERLLQDAVARFPSVNMDLIYGLQFQTMETWQATVQKTIDWGVPSVTLYHLEIRDGTPIQRTFLENPGHFPDERTCLQMYANAKATLLSAGYSENLVGWFLLPRVADTVVYRERWEKQTPCIAFGPGVHNYGPDHFYDTLDKRAYITSARAGRLPIESMREMTTEKRLVWYVLAQWKSNKRVYKEEIRQRFGKALIEWFSGLIQDYVGYKILIETDDAFDMTEAAKALLDWILRDIIHRGLGY